MPYPAVQGHTRAEYGQVDEKSCTVLLNHSLWVELSPRLKLKRLRSWIYYKFFCNVFQQSVITSMVSNKWLLLWLTPKYSSYIAVRFFSWFHGLKTSQSPHSCWRMRGQIMSSDPCIIRDVLLNNNVSWQCWIVTCRNDGKIDQKLLFCSVDVLVRKWLLIAIDNPTYLW